MHVPSFTCTISYFQFFYMTFYLSWRVFQIYSSLASCLFILFFFDTYIGVKIWTWDSTQSTLTLLLVSKASLALLIRLLSYHLISFISFALQFSHLLYYFQYFVLYEEIYKLHMFLSDMGYVFLPDPRLGTVSFKISRT